MSKYYQQLDWDSVPHLTDAAKADLIKGIPPYQRDARSKGIPQLGAGAIYPVPESDVVVPDFEIPHYWPRAYGMDVGWNRTACIWGARNNETGIIYLYSEYYRGLAEPVVHVQGIRSRGQWIPGVIDPNARGRGQADGAQLYQMYVDLGLNIEYANNAVEAGIYEVWQLMSSGRLKVFKSCTNWLQEFRLYRRDESGKVVKENDHLQDSCRYLIMSGRDLMKVQPVEKEPAREWQYGNAPASGWMV